MKQTFRENSLLETVDFNLVTFDGIPTATYRLLAEGSDRRLAGGRWPRPGHFRRRALSAEPAGVAR
jgi:hypothetical protein